MWLGVVIGVVFGTAQLIYSYSKRREPEPPNNALKLPCDVILAVACIVLAVADIWPILFGLLAVPLVVQIPFILRKRNPWWMQAAIDRQKQPRQRSTAL
jgi:hypothetical protein